MILITSAGPSELLVYAIWQEMLHTEDTEYERASDGGNWPMFPAISRGKRHLLSTAFAPYLFDCPATPSQVCDFKFHVATETPMTYCIIIPDENR